MDGSIFSGPWGAFIVGVWFGVSLTLVVISVYLFKRESEGRDGKH
jgi:hypothetical protein